MKSAHIEETQIHEGPLVLTRRMPAAQTVAIGFFVGVGSRDEVPQQAGIAHALEHMLFKGTSQRDVHELGDLLDTLGGNANAFTSRERTCFHMHVLHEDWQQALELLAEMMLEATIPEEEWQREREVIFSEMAMVEDSPDEWAFDQHMQALFARQALGRPTLGSVDALKGLSSDDLRSYLASFYRPPRLLVAAAGRVEHQEIVDALQALSWPSVAGEMQARKQAERHSGLQLLPRDLEQAHLIMSYPGTKAGSEDRPEAWLANHILGGSMSSRLFREVREKRGLAYHVGSNLSTLTDTGFLSITCGTDPQRLHVCASVIRQCIEEFARHIGEEELARAKRQLEVQLRMGVDSVEGQMLYLGGRLDEEVLLSHSEWVQQIVAVECPTLQAWVERQLADTPLVTLCGNGKVIEGVADQFQ